MTANVIPKHPVVLAEIGRLAGPHIEWLLPERMREHDDRPIVAAVETVVMARTVDGQKRHGWSLRLVMVTDQTTPEFCHLRRVTGSFPTTRIARPMGHRWLPDARAPRPASETGAGGHAPAPYGGLARSIILVPALVALKLLGEGFADPVLYVTDVFEHELMRGVLVMTLDRLEDRAVESADVFLHGPRRVDDRYDLENEVRERIHERPQRQVASTLGDSPVEEETVRSEVPLSRQRALLTFEHQPEFGDVLGAGPAGGQTRDRRFDEKAGFGQFLDGRCGPA